MSIRARKDSMSLANHRSAPPSFARACLVPTLKVWMAFARSAREITRGVEWRVRKSRVDAPSIALYRRRRTPQGRVAAYGKSKPKSSLSAAGIAAGIWPEYV